MRYRSYDHVDLILCNNKQEQLASPGAVERIEGVGGGGRRKKRGRKEERKEGREKEQPDEYSLSRTSYWLVLILH